MGLIIGMRDLVGFGGGRGRRGMMANDMCSIVMWIVLMRRNVRRCGGGRRPSQGRDIVLMISAIIMLLTINIVGLLLKMLLAISIVLLVLRIAGIVVGGMRIKSRRLSVGWGLGRFDGRWRGHGHAHSTVIAAVLEIIHFVRIVVVVDIATALDKDIQDKEEPQRACHDRSEPHTVGKPYKRERHEEDVGSRRRGRESTYSIFGREEGRCGRYCS